MIKLSLCVPIYGVEKEIPRFLASLEKNLCDGTEVILVDDGTKDNSGKIADAFAEKHPAYVRVIHKPNGGLSSARNAGLDMARGEYILFPDPDDYLADDYVSVILKAIEEYDSPDMIFFDYYTGNAEKGFKRKTVSSFREGRITKEMFVREFIKDDEIRSYVWNKAIKRCLYGDRRFDTEIRVAEDYDLLTDMVVEMTSFVYIPKALCYYVVRLTSLTRTASMKDVVALYRIAVRRYDKFSQIYDGISLCSVINFANNVIKFSCEKSDDIDTAPFERVIKENIGQIFTSNEYPFNVKKRAIFVWLGIARWYYRRKG